MLWFWRSKTQEGLGGASDTAEKQWKGVRNNRNDRAACCFTGNGERGWGGVGRALGHRGPMLASRAKQFYPDLLFASAGPQTTISEYEREEKRPPNQQELCKITTPYREQVGLM